MGSAKDYRSISKSADGGQTWMLDSVVPPAHRYSLAIDPVSPSTLYAVYWGSASPRVWGIVKSVDSCENWSVLDTGCHFPLILDFASLATSLYWPSARPPQRLSTPDVSFPIL